MKLVFITTIILFSFITYSQTKKTLSDAQYSEWKSIFGIQQSLYGNIVAYEINPAEGDGFLYVNNISNSNETRFARGYKAKINSSEQYVAFMIKPQYDTLRDLKLIQTKADKLPKDSLGIYLIQQDSTIKISEVLNFQIPEQNNWMAFLSCNDLRPICKKKKCRLFKSKCSRPETSGTTLTVFNPTTGKKQQFHGVKDYQFDKSAKRLLISSSFKNEDDKETYSVNIIDLATLEQKVIAENFIETNGFIFSESGDNLCFLGSLDTNKRKTFALYNWGSENKMARIIVDSTNTGMPAKWTVSEHKQPYFSLNGNYVFFGTNKIVEQAVSDTTKLDSEKAKLDVWSSQDLRLQPQQLLELKKDEKKTYLAVYDLKANKFVQLADSIVEIVITDSKTNANFAIGISNADYEREKNWEYPWKRDFYKISLDNGDKQIIKTGLAYQGLFSPSGNYFVWYEGADSSWYSKKSGTKTKQNLTQGLNATFSANINGNPYIAEPEGAEGWTKIDETEFILIYSKNDIWAFCPADHSKSFSITKGVGAKTKTRYQLKQLEQDSTYIDLNTTLIHTVNRQTKDESYYKLNLEDYTLTKLISSAHKYTYISKAEKSNAILFRRMNFKEYPELESTDLDFKSITKLTKTNPQQEEYNWGTVEIVEWTSFKGKNLRGLLYKPEDFDSTKKYPMITYFYETYTENIHVHYVPKPTASIVFPTEYVSNGYIIFIPDIKYTPGEPANSAYDCIVSGTDYLTKKHQWIDSTRLGLQGQSWGGYQTAQLITMTDKYKAAMAGAPVSNMFSAYGGIRWGSGYSRMFQYEHTQSRIGYTIWEKPELYIENSPLFGLPNVKTPLLIMHNDGDGAVPWYQGIELFMGLRRLNQPVWLLNYNDDGHNLMNTANRKDLSIRMRQFFDYYLLNAPIPNWMENGVPAMKKGIDYGLELKK